jgi:hypothetical protein
MAEQKVGRESLLLAQGCAMSVLSVLCVLFRLSRGTFQHTLCFVEGSAHASHTAGHLHFWLQDLTVNQQTLTLPTVLALLT